MSVEPSGAITTANKGVKPATHKKHKWPLVAANMEARPARGGPLLESEMDRGDQ